MRDGSTRMRTYLNRKEHEAAGDYTRPVLIRGHYYRISKPPIFEELRDTVPVEAVLLSDFDTNKDEQPGRYVTGLRSTNAK